MTLNISPDDVCWAQAETISDTWLLQFLAIDILRPIADFILQHNRGNATEFAILRTGSYNISLRLQYEPHGATVIRFPQPGAVLFPEEKVIHEVSVMRFLTDQTTIPVPFILHSGTKQESPLALSPFILMEYLEHETKLYDALNTPGLPREQRGVLDPDITQEKLERLYAPMADVLLQLSLPALPRIGSLSQRDDFTWEVTRRPLSMNMNELVRLGCLPRSQLPSIDTTFPTASAYVQSLADFTYAAPVEFCHAPPGWLLIERPEEWAGGIEAWSRVFEARLQTSLRVMRECEDREIQRGRFYEGQRLSGPMEKSWESGDFWVMYALRNSFAFDLVYWLEIDERFFGDSGRGADRAWEKRVGLLSEKERREMELLVTMKMAERGSRPLVWDADEYTWAFQRKLDRRRDGDGGGKDEVGGGGTGADGMDSR
ncbi:hypothetical protein BO86DRAFT_410485 [Aspergillus japonicus CBS 114.51]|uniref:Aminoglycoside phosphotransferase domain-containing protein n=1 Tax=Aspergillus japonicus CBS 114.51 TaxID=1448312 RepID=A0A8T8WYI5_ASPJA|nr:hypothetical protein BO86DRAFT_410485 [Aspergillus japonicus CBS 114.51]RAH80937.1 hypothetical protein BO86DRAFT_410485 [Aspergillus japonicus CBS 114.51]